MKKAKYCNKICELDFKVNNMGTLLFLQAVIMPEIIGISSRSEALYGGVAKKINASAIGKDVDFIYSKGYNGRAIVSDVIIK